jgi:1-phosphatidylinositol-3-phosphate 5-kinase
LESFLQFAPQYFDYLSKVYFHQVPTALTKIFGVYTVHYKRKRGKSVKQDIIVMENLFYKRTISKVKQKISFSKVNVVFCNKLLCRSLI